MKKQIKKYVIIFSFLFSLLLIIKIIFVASNLTSDSSIVNIVLTITPKAFLICLLILIFYIKSKVVKYSILTVYMAIIGLGICFYFFPNLFGFYKPEFNSEYSLVYSRRIDDKYILKVFNYRIFYSKKRDTDGKMYPVLMRDLGFSIKKHWFSDRSKNYWNFETDSSEVVINGRKYSIPSPTQLNKMRIDKEKSIKRN